jgi:hypothetical protein
MKFLNSKMPIFLFIFSTFLQIIKTENINEIMMDKELLKDMQNSNTVPTLKETISDLKKVISRKLQSCNNTI